ncbi:DUF1638 domain-containing protein [Geomonas azotofigens]|uniref:DUF1638 domain-containing protein n=1 Tax=Geomonas azotofigens TaxID=2843196 RepID=UPI001C12728E|nr:DUF1638 domain-containing protein [Geomonas azotofigens]MBU5615309.1 DUF1638 domain-containing protein [Geomonas azotofigens]
MTGATVWLACGVLREELTRLRRDGRIAGELVFLDSLLHMNPPLLESTLNDELLRRRAGGDRLVLVYGDCCAGMLDLARNFGAGRVKAINCAQLLLGRERYRELMREEAFLVLPEWAERWEEVMASALGPDPAAARALLTEHRAVLVYLDTGLVPVPARQMEAFSAYSGLPWRVEVIGLETALAGLLEAEARGGEQA